MKPSFFSVARQPKWIGGLAVAALVAIVFSLLMQWQLSRTFSYVGVSQEQAAPVALSELAGPGYIQPGSFDRLVTVEATLNPSQTFIVDNRLQFRDDGLVEGYWLITNSLVQLEQGPASLTLALAFSTEIDDLIQIRQGLPEKSFSITGYVEPSDPVADTELFYEGEPILGSVALAQLVNLYQGQEFVSYPVYVIVTDGLSLGAEPILIDIRDQSLEINWLTAFYALEWAFFALVAFYLWWRLVQDERERLAT